jgi:hypothetical protein
LEAESRSTMRKISLGRDRWNRPEPCCFRRCSPWIGGLRILPALERRDTRILRRVPSIGSGRMVIGTMSDNAANAGIAIGRPPMRADQAELCWTARSCRAVLAAISRRLTAADRPPVP